MELSSTTRAPFTLPSESYFNHPVFHSFFAPHGMGHRPDCILMPENCRHRIQLEEYQHQKPDESAPISLHFFAPHRTQFRVTRSNLCCRRRWPSTMQSRFISLARTFDTGRVSLDTIFPDSAGRSDPCTYTCPLAVVPQTLREQTPVRQSQKPQHSVAYPILDHLLHAPPSC